MKRIIETTDVAGLESLLGERVRLMCANYFYEGTLSGVNATFVMLEDAAIVYDTNAEGKATTTGKPASSPWYVQTAAIESYGRTK